MHHDKHCIHDQKGLLSWLLSWKGVGLIMGLAAVSYYLLTVHLAHLAVALPYLFLLACPLMHIFGHKHGHDDKKQG
ncbi:MAG: DUF2933 domain-containing protein [Alphaproteobacteria bacterium]|nr:DUF2933 domain-containing protein [Alphaproteobacteria bacterium]